MSKIANNNRAIMLAVTTALATTALAGCTTTAAAPADLSASKAQTALAKGDTSQAIGHAEATVLAEPRNAGYRAMLGAVYMEAGRFQSAATSFKDAMDLGDNSGRTALSLALAQIAAGQQDPALATLNQFRDSIDPSDLGLAMSLAGRPEQGVHILGNALRGGQTTPKVRQNLAYSYALMGNWRAARLMAAEDVPAGQLGERMSEWAQTSAPESYQARVAHLLNVPVVGDAGQPAMLALANHASPAQLAAEALAPATPAQALASKFAAAPQYELPALGSNELPPAMMARPAPATTVAANIVPPTAEPQNFEDAFVGSKAVATPSPRVASTGVSYVANPTVQKVPNAASAGANVVADTGSTLAGDHLIQLGSFSSEAGAKRAWGIYIKRYPQLKNYEMVITEAKVRGKNYFRVSAGGFQRAAASGMCSTVKANNQGCITWAANKPLPGAVDRGVRMARR
ncbi:MAG: SPOR domain-containing protein [Pontixanthobacter sp.]